MVVNQDNALAPDVSGGAAAGGLIGVPSLDVSDNGLRGRIERSPRYGAGKFHGEGEPVEMPMKGMASATWEYLFGGAERTPARKLPVEAVDPAAFSRSGNDQLTVTWLGHSSLMINVDGYRILTDPVFEKSISIVGPARFNGDVPVAIEDLGRIDAVIISHDHYDHLNRSSVKALKEKAARFIVPLAVGARLERWGVPREQIVELDWWEEYAAGEGLTVAATPARHFSGRGLTDRNRTLWASWAVMGPRHRIFFSGDSGYFDGIKRIGEKYGPFDMTFIECGAYNAAWSEVHMFPEETVLAHQDLKGDVLHPIHWGTFNLAPHPWYEPMQRLTAAAGAAGIRTATPAVGGTTVYGDKITENRWWEEGMAEPLYAESAAGGH